MKSIITILTFLLFCPMMLMSQNQQGNENRIKALVRVFFNTNKDVLTGTAPSEALNSSGEKEAIERGSKKELDISEKVVSRMKAKGISYSKGKVKNVNFTSLEINGNQATATAVVTMEMSIKAAAGAPDKTQYDDAYNFSFAKEGNKWIMVEHNYLPPGSIAGPALPANSNASLLDSLPKAEEGMQQLKEGKNPNPKSRQRGNNGNNGGGGPNGIDDWRLMGTYSASAAASYARTYALNPNSSYRDFGNNCTNFVSQALKKGGWTHESGSGRKEKDAWYYGSFSWTTSYTWGGSHNHYLFHKYSGRSFRLSYYSDLYLGDVISVDMYGPNYSSQPLDGYCDHTVIVTATSGTSTSQIFVSYQTSNTLNRPLDDFITRAQGSNGANLYAWGLYYSY